MSLTSIAERLHAQGNEAALYEHAIKLEECNLHYQQIIESRQRPTNELAELWDVLQLAERGLEYARNTTSFLQHKWRIMNAEDIRNKAQAKYNDALNRAIAARSNPSY